MKTTSLLAVLFLLSACTPIADKGFRKELRKNYLDENTTLLGGQTTVFVASQKAYSFAIPGIFQEQQRLFLLGESLFKYHWPIASSSTKVSAGRGPLFNASSCSVCHLRNGRSHPKLSLVIRLSVPGKSEKQGKIAEPHYGDQLNVLATPDIAPEGKVVIRYETLTGQFEDGEPFQLQKPTYAIKETAYGALHLDTKLSPRVAPFLVGLGLIEAIPEERILALADPEDKDKDGISGRPNYVWDQRSQKTVLGRFGWKANQPSLIQQTAQAFLGDIGITSPLFLKENCTAVQRQCQKASSGGMPELTLDALEQVVVYLKTLAVPAQRNGQASQVELGRSLFGKAGCGACHTFQFKTGLVKDFPFLSHQVIYLYSDLLLHDMGAGLADQQADFRANGREWRTAPLWGIGLMETVNGHTHFLHDGRARNLTEAILWHGGEAEAAKERFRKMPKNERVALLAFLNSL